jgi:hypothetical protein
VPSPRVVSAQSIGHVLRAFGYPSSRVLRDIPTIAEAIGAASNEDPLFPDQENGGAATAAILCAIAWHRSRLDAYGRSGSFLGLFRISNELLLPRSAARYAVDLVRQSTERCQHLATDERFAFFDALGRQSDPLRPDALARSWSLLVTTTVLERAWPRLRASWTLEGSPYQDRSLELCA